MQLLIPQLSYVDAHRLRLGDALGRIGPAPPIVLLGERRHEIQEHLEHRSRDLLLGTIAVGDGWA